MHRIIIGEQIKKARQEKGLSQKMLADAVDMNVRTLRFHETGKSEGMDARKLHRIAMLLEKPMEFFISGRETVKPVERWVHLPESIRHRVYAFIDELNRYFKRRKRGKKRK